MTIHKGVVVGTAFMSLLITVLVATAAGNVDLALDHTATILFDAITMNAHPSGAMWERVVVLGIRLPRVLLAAVAGGGLAVAGGALQGLFRNPMADPGILGVSAGAAFGAVTALYLGAAFTSPIWVPAAAFASATTCTYLVYALSSLRGRTPVSTLLLAGIAVSGIANALTTLVLSLSLADWEVGRQMMSWLMGGLDGRSWYHLALTAPIVIGGSLWILAHSRELDALLTGEESALSVGVDVLRAKRQLIVLASLVTAATVSVMGVVPFAGLMVPHMVRLVVGAKHSRLLPVSFLMGAIFLVLADLACRVLPLADLRLGVVTSLLGGPFFLFLLMRHRSRAGAT